MAAPTIPSDGNGRVTYGRLLERVDYTAAAVDRLAERLDAYIDRNTDWKQKMELSMQDSQSEVEHVKTLMTRWGVVNVTGTIGVIIHAIASAMGVKL